MKLHRSKQEYFFAAYQKGDSHSLIKIYLLEKPYLFDYLLRMTAAPLDIQETLAACLAEMKVGNYTWNSLDEVRYEIYRYCRSKMQDLWNQKSEQLRHPLLTTILLSPQTPENVRKEAQFIIDLNQALNSSPTLKKEILILHFRIDLKFSDIAKITLKDEKDIRKNYQEALSYLKTQITYSSVDLSSQLKKLPLYPIPDNRFQIRDFLSKMSSSSLERNIHLTPIAMTFFLILAVLLVLLIFILIKFS